MKIELVQISSIKENPDNPRLIKDDKFLKLVESIKSFPEMLRIRPIVINSDNVILGGNMRLKACKEAGLKEVPIIKAGDLTEEQQKEFIIKDNVGFGEWDWEMLTKDWNGEELEDWGLDISEDWKAEEGEAVEDDYEIPDEIETDIVLGDLIEIGEHRLLCGDSTDSDQVARLMDGKKADMVFTDPPYNVNYESKHTGKILNDNMSDEDFEQFIRDVYTMIDFATAKDSFIYICHATMIIAFDTVLREMEWEINNKIIWVKDIPTFSMARYKWKYEPIHFCIKGKPTFYGDQTQTNVWEIKSIQSAGNTDDQGNTWFDGGSKNLTLHPTQKPFQLPEKAIGNSSKMGDLIFEPFTGSGSTMVASHQLNRKCYGMELDPKYCQIIINRMIALDESLVIKINGEEYNGI